jgi:D-lactate dehydrogenase
MRCAVQKDAYHTVSALTFVTPSGAVIDTSRPDAEKEFALAEPQLAEGLLELRRELLADPVLADRTRRKYAIRNTHGLRLCALLDGETPLGIFRRLLVGSEGTLAFIAEAVLETTPAPRAELGAAFLPADLRITDNPRAVSAPKGLEAVARRRRETFHLLYRWLQTESARRCHGFDQKA